MFHLISVLLLSTLGFSKTAQLVYTPQFVLDKVLDRKQIVSTEEKPLPQIKYASHTKIKEFQDDIEPQWGFRPDEITNAYIIKKNIVYLVDDLAYYEKVGRFIDDSLAHELTHFVQVQYQNWDITVGDASIEADAVDIQTWFRETFCSNPGPFLDK